MKNPQVKNQRMGNATPDNNNKKTGNGSNSQKNRKRSHMESKSSPQEMSSSKGKDKRRKSTSGSKSESDKCTGSKRKMTQSNEGQGETSQLTPKKGRVSRSFSESPGMQKPLTERQQLAYLLEMTARESMEDNLTQDKETKNGIVEEGDKKTPKSEKKSVSKMNKRNERGETQMHLLAIRGDVEGIRKLISQGADVNVTDYAGWTPLHEACNRGHYKIVKVLLRAGALATARGLDGDTPLHDASSNGHLKIVTALLRYGGDPCLKNHHGETPIDVAASDEVEDILENYSQRKAVSPEPEADKENGTNGRVSPTVEVDDTETSDPVIEIHREHKEDTSRKDRGNKSKKSDEKKDDPTLKKTHPSEKRSSTVCHNQNSNDLVENKRTKSDTTKESETTNVSKEEASDKGNKTIINSNENNDTKLTNGEKDLDLQEVENEDNESVKTESSHKVSEDSGYRSENSCHGDTIYDEGTDDEKDSVTPVKKQGVIEVEVDISSPSTCTNPSDSSKDNVVNDVVKAENKVPVDTLDEVSSLIDTVKNEGTSSQEEASSSSCGSETIFDKLEHGDEKCTSDPSPTEPKLEQLSPQNLVSDILDSISRNDLEFKVKNESEQFSLPEKKSVKKPQLCRNKSPREKRNLDNVIAKTNAVSEVYKTVKESCNGNNSSEAKEKPRILDIDGVSVSLETQDTVKSTEGIDSSVANDNDSGCTAVSKPSKTSSITKDSKKSKRYRSENKIDNLEIKEKSLSTTKFSKLDNESTGKSRLNSLSSDPESIPVLTANTTKPSSKPNNKVRSVLSMDKTALNHVKDQIAELRNKVSFQFPEEKKNAIQNDQGKIKEGTELTDTAAKKDVGNVKVKQEHKDTLKSKTDPALEDKVVKSSPQLGSSKKKHENQIKERISEQIDASVKNVVDDQSREESPMGIPVSVVKGREEASNLVNGNVKTEPDCHGLKSKTQKNVMAVLEPLVNSSLENVDMNEENTKGKKRRKVKITTESNSVKKEDLMSILVPPSPIVEDKNTAKVSKHGNDNEKPSKKRTQESPSVLLGKSDTKAEEVRKAVGDSLPGFINSKSPDKHKSKIEIRHFRSADEIVIAKGSPKKALFNLNSEDAVKEKGKKYKSNKSPLKVNPVNNVANLEAGLKIAREDGVSNLFQHELWGNKNSKTKDDIKKVKCKLKDDAFRDAIAPTKNKEESISEMKKAPRVKEGSIKQTKSPSKGKEKDEKVKVCKVKEETVKQFTSPSKVKEEKAKFTKGMVNHIGENIVDCNSVPKGGDENTKLRTLQPCKQEDAKDVVLSPKVKDVNSLLKGKDIVPSPKGQSMVTSPKGKVQNNKDIKQIQKSKFTGENVKDLAERSKGKEIQKEIKSGDEVLGELYRNTLEEPCKSKEYQKVLCTQPTELLDCKVENEKWLGEIHCNSVGRDIMENRLTPEKTGRESVKVEGSKEESIVESVTESKDQEVPSNKNVTLEEDTSVAKPKLLSPVEARVPTKCQDNQEIEAVKTPLSKEDDLGIAGKSVKIKLKPSKEIPKSKDDGQKTAENKDKDDVLSGNDRKSRKKAKKSIDFDIAVNVCEADTGTFEPLRKVLDDSHRSSATESLGPHFQSSQMGAVSVIKETKTALVTSGSDIKFGEVSTTHPDAAVQGLETSSSQDALPIEIDVVDTSMQSTKVDAMITEEEGHQSVAKEESPRHDILSSNATSSDNCVISRPLPDVTASTEAGMADSEDSVVVQVPDVAVPATIPNECASSSESTQALAIPSTSMPDSSSSRPKECPEKKIVEIGIEIVESYSDTFDNISPDLVSPKATTSFESITPSISCNSKDYLSANDINMVDLSIHTDCQADKGRRENEGVHSGEPEATSTASNWHCEPLSLMDSVKTEDATVQSAIISMSDRDDTVSQQVSLSHEQPETSQSIVPCDEGVAGPSVPPLSGPVLSVASTQNRATTVSASTSTGSPQSLTRTVDLEPCDIVRTMMNSDFPDCVHSLTTDTSNSLPPDSSCATVTADGATEKMIDTEVTSTGIEDMANRHAVCSSADQTEGKVTTPTHTVVVPKRRPRSPPSLSTWRQVINAKCKYLKYTDGELDLLGDSMMFSKLYKLREGKVGDLSIKEQEEKESLVERLSRRHTVELEKLHLAMEQELIRVQSRCKLLWSEKVPVSACSTLTFQEDEMYKKLPENVTSRCQMNHVEDVENLRIALINDTLERYINMEKNLLVRHQLEREGVETKLKLWKLIRVGRRGLLKEKYRRLKKLSSLS